jgi:hypothetical protein
MAENAAPGSETDRGADADLAGGPRKRYAGPVVDTGGAVVLAIVALLALFVVLGPVWYFGIDQNPAFEESAD